MSVEEWGALAFGIVVGWVTYRTLRRTSENVGLSNIASVIGAVGGAAITTLFHTDRLFGFYAIGLAGGFFAYLVIGVTLLRDVQWLGNGD